jgi:hypothetical protein
MVNGNLYLVWSNEHAGWWAQGRFGYTTDVAKAGRYTRERAIEICRNALPGWRQGMPFPEIPVSEADALELEAVLREGDFIVHSKDAAGAKWTLTRRGLSRRR